MKSIKKIIMVTVFVLAFAAAVPGQERILKEGDVKHFIDTYKPIGEEMESLELNFGIGDEGFSYSEGMEANTAVLNILKKYGWDISFFEKAFVIAMLYGTIEMEEQFAEANPEIKQALEEIDNNDYFTPEMKAQMREQLLAVLTMMQESPEQSQEAMHPEDIEQVRKYKKELEALFN